MISFATRPVFATDTPISLVAPVGRVTTATFKIHNLGTGTLTLGPPFPFSTGTTISVAPATGFALEAGMASAPIVVSCAPTDTSPGTQDLTYPTNDPARPSATYAITCTGLDLSGGGGTGTGGGTGALTPELPSGGLLGVGMLALLALRGRLRRKHLA